MRFNPFNFEDRPNGWNWIGIAYIGVAIYVIAMVVWWIDQRGLDDDDDRRDDPPPKPPVPPSLEVLAEDQKRKKAARHAKMKARGFKRRGEKETAPTAPLAEPALTP